MAPTSTGIRTVGGIRSVLFAKSTTGVLTIVSVVLNSINSPLTRGIAALEAIWKSFKGALTLEVEDEEYEADDESYEDDQEETLEENCDNETSDEERDGFADDEGSDDESDEDSD